MFEKFENKTDVLSFSSEPEEVSVPHPESRIPFVPSFSTTATTLRRHSNNMARENPLLRNNRNANTTGSSSGRTSAAAIASIPLAAPGRALSTAICTQEVITPEGERARQGTQPVSTARGSLSNTTTINTPATLLARQRVHALWNERYPPPETATETTSAIHEAESIGHKIEAAVHESPLCIFCWLSYDQPKDIIYINHGHSVGAHEQCWQRMLAADPSRCPICRRQLKKNSIFYNGEKKTVWINRKPRIQRFKDWIIEKLMGRLRPLDRRAGARNVAPQ